MGIKLVNIPGASQKALAAGRKKAAAMQRAGQTGIKAVYLEGTIVLVRVRSAIDALVLPITPKLKTYNDMDALDIVQDLNNFRAEAFNNIGGLQKNTFYTAAEVADEENYDTAIIRDAEDPDLYRIIGSNDYNIYENAQSANFFHELTTLILEEMNDDSLITGSLRMLQAADFLARTSDEENTLYDWIVSRIPSDMCVEDTLLNLLLTTTPYVPMTIDGDTLATTEGYYDANYVRVIPAWCREKNGEYVVACEVQAQHLSSIDLDDRPEILNPYDPEDVDIAYSNSKHGGQYVVIAAKDLFRMKTRPYSVTLNPNFNAYSGIEPGFGNVLAWSRVDSVAFSGLTDSNPLITLLDSEQPFAHCPGVTAPWVGNATDFHQIQGNGTYEWDYGIPGFPESVDVHEVRAGILQPFITTNSDFTTEAFSILPLRIEITKGAQSGEYSGIYYYIPLFNPLEGYDSVNEVSLFVPAGTVQYPEIISVQNVRSDLTLSGYAVESQYLLPTSLRQQVWLARQVGVKTEPFGVHPNNGTTQWQTHYAWYKGVRQNNREIYYGFTATELILYQESIESSQSINGETAYYEKLFYRHTRTTLASMRKTIDFDGTNIVVSNDTDTAVMNVANTGASFSGRKFLPNGSSIWSGFSNPVHSVTMPGYSVQWRPRPDESRTLYSVSSTKYEWAKQQSNANNTGNQPYYYDTPGRNFTNGDINAQNIEIPYDLDSTIRTYPNLLTPRYFLRFGNNKVETSEAMDSILFNGEEILDTSGDFDHREYANGQGFQVGTLMIQNYSGDDYINWMFAADFVMEGYDEWDDGVYLDNAPDDYEIIANYRVELTPFSINYTGAKFLFTVIGDKMPNQMDDYIYNGILSQPSFPNATPFPGSTVLNTHHNRNLRTSYTQGLGTRATPGAYPFQWASGTLSNWPTLTIRNSDSGIYVQRAWSTIHGLDGTGDFGIFVSNWVTYDFNGAFPYSDLQRVNLNNYDGPTVAYALRPYTFLDAGNSKYAIVTDDYIRLLNTVRVGSRTVRHNEWLNRFHVVGTESGGPIALETPVDADSSYPTGPDEEEGNFYVGFIFPEKYNFNRDED